MRTLGVKCAQDTVRWWSPQHVRIWAHGLFVSSQRSSYKGSLTVFLRSDAEGVKRFIVSKRRAYNLQEGLGAFIASHATNPPFYDDHPDQERSLVGGCNTSIDPSKAAPMQDMRASSSWSPSPGLSVHRRRVGHPERAGNDCRRYGVDEHRLIPDGCSREVQESHHQTRRLSGCQSRLALHHFKGSRQSPEETRNHVRLG